MFVPGLRGLGACPSAVGGFNRSGKGRVGRTVVLVMPVSASGDAGGELADMDQHVVMTGSPRRQDRFMDRRASL